MATFVALLRGVNVSGKNKLPMADLRAAVESAGFSNVRIYLQSGNVVVDSKGSAKSIGQQIHQLIDDNFSLDVSVLVRTARQWHQVAASNSYFEAGIDPKRLYVTFTGRKTKSSDKKRLDTIKLGEDRYSLHGSEIYLDLVSGAGRTKLTNNAIEKKLEVVATTRNWRTVQQILAMLP
ncbi:MAG: DUF1697 domain-containing protein [Planctomycetaceae bacterium]